MAATRSLWKVGLLELGGYVLEPSAAETLATVDVVELKQLLDAAADVQVVDVRESFERDTGYIPGSRNIPYRLLRKLGCGALDRSKPVVTVCESRTARRDRRITARARRLRRPRGLARRRRHVRRRRRVVQALRRLTDSIA